jgi:hypothetical protein
VVLLAAPDLHAQDSYWNPGNATGDWDTSTPIWATSAGGPFTGTWTDGGLAFLNAHASGTTASLTTAILANGLTFTGTFTVTAAGGDLTLNDGATIQSADGNGHLILTAQLFGANSLAFGGGPSATSVYLNASNTFANGITVAADTRVSIGNAGNTVGTVQDGTLVGNVALADASSVISFESSQFYDISVVSGSGSLEVVSPTAGGTTLALGNAQTLTGAVRVRENSALALLNDGSGFFGEVATASQIHLYRNATLDLSQYANGTWTLPTTQTLVVRGTTAANGGRIVGNARIAGTLDLTGEPTGNRAGTLRQEAGDLTVAGGATWRMNIKNWTGTTPGADFSQVLGVGGAKLDLSEASAGNKIVLDIRGLDLAGFGPGVGGSWVIADFSAGNTSGGIVGFDPDKFQIDTSSFGQDLGTTEFVLSTDANSNKLILSFNPVPEPAAVLGVAAAGLVLGGLARRRRGITSSPA